MMIFLFCFIILSSGTPTILNYNQTYTFSSSANGVVFLAENVTKGKALWLDLIGTKSPSVTPFIGISVGDSSSSSYFYGSGSTSLRQPASTCPFFEDSNVVSLLVNYTSSAAFHSSFTARLSPKLELAINDPRPTSFDICSGNTFASKIFYFNVTRPNQSLYLLVNSAIQQNTSSSMIAYVSSTCDPSQLHNATLMNNKKAVNILSFNMQFQPYGLLQLVTPVIGIYFVHLAYAGIFCTYYPQDPRYPYEYSGASVRILQNSSSDQIVEGGTVILHCYGLVYVILIAYIFMSF